jgi:hypothetical protein
MLALCPYCNQNCADVRVPEFQRRAHEMYKLESADLQMSPSDLGLGLNLYC